MNASDVKSVTAHYDAFPFPPPRPDLGDIAVSVASLPAGSSIWVAGCGTMQGARWARAFPDCSVIATDFSAITLRVAAELADRHGLPNIRFRTADLRDARSSDADGVGSFDMIVCTGVLHHLPDPRTGLRAIARALHPDGRALLMLYRRSVRAPLAELRRAVLSRSGPDAEPSERMAIATQLLAERTDRLGVLLRRLVTDTPAVVADAITNPIEHHFEPDELTALLAGTGIAFDHWLHDPAAGGNLEFFCRPDPTAAG